MLASRQLHQRQLGPVARIELCAPVHRRPRLPVLCSAATAAAKPQAAAVKAAVRTRIIGLDFGTHSSGFAAASSKQAKPDGPMLQHEGWPDQPCPYPKTRSALLYQGRRPVAWGWTAAKRLSELSPSEAAEHWYIEDFKLALQDENKAAEIRAKGLTPEQVVADYLQCFTQYVKQELKRSGVAAPDIDNAQWCLTVPAMWSEASKALMRRAAKRAGLIRDINDDALSIILEPEAAALHARHAKMPPLKEGMTVCVLDVGGGTADITVHNVIKRGRQCVLAEAVSADGAMCGSQYVDMAFRSHLATLLGQTTFDQWSQNHGDEWRMVQDKWITCKHAYTGDVMQVFRIPIPPRLQQSLPQATRDKLSHQQGVANPTDITLDSLTLTSLFNGPVTQVVEAATKQLKQLDTQSCDLVLLVGGFAQSPYLQSRVRAALADTGLAKELVVPPTPYAAVLQGAVLYGCDPTLIHARRSRMAYGVKTCTAWQDGAPLHSKFMHKEDQTPYSNARFVPFVRKGELVAHDQAVSRTFHPLYQNQTTTTMLIWATDDNDAKWIDIEKDGVHHQLADVEVQLSDPGEDRDIQVDFHFGQTEIRVSAWDPEKGAKAHTRVKFATDKQ